MGRAPLIAFGLVLCLAAIPVAMYLGKPREVVASTPSDYTGLTVPLPLPARGEACADEIVFDTDAEVARLGATMTSGTAPDLEIVASGYRDGPYRNDYRAVARVHGGWKGVRHFDVPIGPPERAAWGTFCVRNLGARPVDLIGSHDGRAFSRPSVKVNGEPTGTELQLHLLESGERPLWSRLGEMTTHATTIKPFGAWWMWVLALVLLVLAPLGIATAIRSALQSDARRLAE